MVPKKAPHASGKRAGLGQHGTCGIGGAASGVAHRPPPASRAAYWAGVSLGAAWSQPATTCAVGVVRTARGSVALGEVVTS